MAKATAAASNKIRAKVNASSMHREMTLEAPSPTAAGMIGAGKACDDPSTIAANIVDGLTCGIEDLQVVAENRAFFEGPLTAASIENLMVPSLNPFAIGTLQGAAEAPAQINIDGSEMDCNVLITHLYFQMVPPKESMLVEGAAWAGTGVLTSSVNSVIPVVPDAWTVGASSQSGGDATVTTGVLGLVTGQTLTKAYLDVGGWAMDGFYDFSRAYELLWKIGDNIILEYPLVKIASIVPAPQASTSGRDRRPFAQYVADCNAYYRANGTIGLFLPRSATRDGSFPVTGATPATQSVFSPYGYFEEDVTYGGPGVQMLCGNEAVYELCTAQLFPRGVKLGIKFELIDQQAQARASRELSINNGLATTPGVIYPDVSITGASSTGSGANPVFPELTSASPNTQTPLAGPVGTAVFKIGDFYLIMGLMGHRVSQAFYQKCLDSLQPVCSAVAAQTNGMRSLAIMGQGA